MSKSLAALILAMLAGTAGATVPGTDLFVPAVGHGLGAISGGVQAWWRGDVWIFNPSTSQTATVDVYLLLRNQGNPTPAVRRITIDAGDTRYLPDVVYNTFGADNTYGGLRVVSTIPVVVSGRSYDANVTVTGKPQGSAGQFFSGVPAELAIGLGDSTDIIGLDQDAYQTTGLWRSNLAFVETTGNPVDLTISRVDSNGTVLGSIGQHLEGRQVSQINYVLTAVVATYGSNQRIRVAVTGGTGHVITNASRMDNRTGDPATVESVMVYRIGRFEGVVLDATSSTRVDGGIQLQIGGGALTTYSGVTGIGCTDGSSFTLDFSPNGGSSIGINADGTFVTSVSIPYTDGASTLFTTNWTLTGARAADGTWSGTLRSETTGGANVGGYNYAQCNGISTRPWRAAWSGD
jgi:hypothetical protein